jgi:hypothetical protein
MIKLVYEGTGEEVKFTKHLWFDLTIEDTGLEGDGKWLVRLKGFDVAANGTTIRDAMIEMASYLEEIENSPISPFPSFTS